MCKVRGGFLGAVAIGALLSVLPTSGFAGPQATAEQKAACGGDYFRFCFSVNPNANTVVACLRSHKSELSASCRALFDRDEAKSQNARAPAAPATARN
jgi:hypothetical protein